MKAFTILGAVAALFLAPAVAQDAGEAHILPYPYPSSSSSVSVPPSGTPTSPPGFPWPTGAPRPTGAIPTGGAFPWGPYGYPPREDGPPHFAFDRRHARQIRPIVN
ncbi:hypothetical protein BDV25DRAFT_139704 [Aspergillus avenaceus]|uniref:Uncharacterized protein n=1 Tax=Aspergillus avenaceus TaxID=36643 RepID=A0A5N6TWC3_ASPAV|nr:hypothetical protein BDV25DRAFT_139704 [Aspergillus avenaceus]